MKTLRRAYMTACYIVGVPILAAFSMLGLLLAGIYNMVEDGEFGVLDMARAGFYGFKEGHWRNMQWVKHGGDWTNYDWDEYPTTEY